VFGKSITRRAGSSSLLIFGLTGAVVMISIAGGPSFSKSFK